MGVGGTMALVAGVKRVVIIMEYTTEDGSAKILRECTLPLTGRRVVRRIITNLCVVDVTPQGLLRIEVATNVCSEEIRSNTEAKFSERFRRSIGTA